MERLCDRFPRRDHEPGTTHNHCGGESYASSKQTIEVVEDNREERKDSWEQEENQDSWEESETSQKTTEIVKTMNVTFGV